MDFVSHWWPVAIALAAVIGAYFQTREDVASVRGQVRDVQGELARLRHWLEHPEQFPGRNMDGEPLEKGAIERLGGDAAAVDLRAIPPLPSAASEKPQQSSEPKQPAPRPPE